MPRKTKSEGPPARSLWRPCATEGCPNRVTTTLSTRFCSNCQDHANDADHPNSVRQVTLRRREGK